MRLLNKKILTQNRKQKSDLKTKTISTLGKPCHHRYVYLTDSTHYVKVKCHFLHVPYPVSGRRGDVDGQRSLKFLHLHSEQKGCVRHFLHLLLDKLCFCGLLEVFRLCDLVHEAHDLAGFVASSPTFFNKRRVQKSE